MEAYKTTCPDCNYVRRWMGDKTGAGKNKEQLQQMREDHTTCKECGSMRATTDLDHESHAGQVLDAQANALVLALNAAFEKEPY